MKEDQEQHSILIVESSRTLGNWVGDNLAKTGEFNTTICSTLDEARNAIQSHKFLAAIVSLTTDGAAHGEAVDTVIAGGVPVIVFTGSFNETLQKDIWKKPIIDYVVKDNPENINYIICQIRRLTKNSGIKVLLAEDSVSSRLLAGQLLRNHRYQVFEAGDGIEAIEILTKHPDIKLALVDYNMPHMDGFTLIQHIRKSHSKDRLAIIGITSNLSRDTSAHFIKNGANDFIMKPYLIDEFYCRVNQNLETIDHIETIRIASETDYLTGLCNRRYLFRETERYIRHNSGGVAMAMLDIDSFKAVNDRYGHLAGDMAIQHVASKLRKTFNRGETICRYGGDELCIFFPEIIDRNPAELLDSLRADVEGEPVQTMAGDFNITVSIGLWTQPEENAEQLFQFADRMLYTAKRRGRNQVVADDYSDILQDSAVV